MERWHVPSIEAAGRREPRVLFSAPECRAVALDLRAGEVTVQGETCQADTLITFAPDERHTVAAQSDARLVLLLAPWPGDGHYPSGAEFDAARMPANATAPPIS